MRKGLYCILVAVFTSLFITACTDQPANESIEPAETVETVGSQSDTLEEPDEETEDKSETQGESVNETVPDSNSGFPGGVLDDSDTYTEPDEETAGADEKQEPDGFAETTGGDNDESGSNEESDGEEDGTAETVPEETEDAGPIQDNTYDGDLLKPPANGSDGVL